MPWESGNQRYDTEFHPENVKLPGKFRPVNGLKSNLVSYGSFIVPTPERGNDHQSAQLSLELFDGMLIKE